MRKHLKGMIILMLMIFSVTLARPTTLSAVDSNACQLLINTEYPFILVLKKGEDLIPSIINCIEAAHIPSASLSGLGALLNPKLAYFNVDKKKYLYKSFSGIYELTSLTGNITQVDGKPFAHIHVTISDSLYHVSGGHLSDSTVGPTAEITIIPVQAAILRAPSLEGLQLIVTENAKL